MYISTLPGRTAIRTCYLGRRSQRPTGNSNQTEAAQVGRRGTSVVRQHRSRSHSHRAGWTEAGGRGAAARRSRTEAGARAADREKLISAAVWWNRSRTIARAGCQDGRMWGPQWAWLRVCQGPPGPPCGSAPAMDARPARRSTATATGSKLFIIGTEKG
jgi:hypothetical protein